ncbi:phage tail tape measure protein [Serratia sp. CY70267]|uniref:phage tail tape measure protein n=2 Tax=unclassified Serratia (in: enterobacteria) TaxID=2647522 RepID=UPI003FA0AC99
MMSDKNLRLQVLLSAVDKVTRPFKSMQASNKALAASVKATKDQLKQLDTQAGKIDGFRKTKTQVASAAQALSTARDKARSLAIALKSTDSPTAKQARQFQRAREEAAKLQQKYAGLRVSLQNQRTALQNSGVATNRLGEAQRSLRSSISEANSALAAQEKRLDKQAQQQKRLTDARSKYQNTMGVRNQLAGTGAGMLITGKMAIAGLKPVLAESATYSQHVERFRAQGVSDREIQDSQGFVRTHPVIGASQTELMKLYGEAFAITRDEHHTQDATIQLARAETAINMLGSKGLLTPEQTHAFSELSYAMLKNAELRNEIKDPKQFASFINESVKAFAVTQTIVTPKDTNDFMKTGGLAAKDISRNEYFYAFSHLIQEMGGERTGNALNSARQNWIGKRIKERNKDEMDKIGLIDNVTYSKTGHVKDFNLVNHEKFNTAPFKYLLEEVVPRIKKAYPGLSEEGIQLKISDLFSHRTASDLFATMYNQRENIMKQMTAGTKVQDIDTIIGNGEKTAPGQELILEAKKRDLYKQLGDNILPLYIKGLSLINNALTGISGFIEKHPQLAKYFIATAAGMAIMATASGALMLAIAAILGPLAMLKFSTRILGIRLLPNLSLSMLKFASTAPITTSQVKGFSRSLLDTGKNALTFSKQHLGNAGRAVVSFASSPLQTATKGIKGMGRVFTWLATSPLRFLRFALGGLGSMFGILISPLGLIAAAIAGAGLLIYKYWKPIKAFLGGVVEGFKTAAAPIKDAFAPLMPVFTWIGDKVKALWGWFTDLLTPVQSTKTDLDSAASAGKRFGEFLADGIEIALTPLKLLIDSIKWVLGKLDEVKEKSEKTRILAQTNPAVADAAHRAGVTMTPAPQGNSADAIRRRYTGEHDNGGRIPLGKFGVVGEHGPEIVNGPANVTSRKNTAAMAAVAALFMGGAAAAADLPLHPYSLPGSQYQSGSTTSHHQGGDTYIDIHAPIQIVAQSHHSPQDIAREVARQLDARERQARSRANSSFNDIE